LRPYHINSGPAVGHTCSKILAPPLDLKRIDADATPQQHVQ